VWLVANFGRAVRYKLEAVARLEPIRELDHSRLHGSWKARSSATVLQLPAGARPAEGAHDGEVATEVRRHTFVE
jgi:hypothetical protein